MASYHYGLQDFQNSRRLFEQVVEVRGSDVNVRLALFDLAKELNIDLLFLPSYSPNLNLIERLWRFVKKKALYSVYHPTYDNFQGAIDQCLDDLPHRHKEELDRLMTHRFQTFKNVPFLNA